MALYFYRNAGKISFPSNNRYGIMITLHASNFEETRIFGYKIKNSGFDKINRIKIMYMLHNIANCIMSS